MASERLPIIGDIVWQNSYADHLARYQFASEYVYGRTVLDAGTGIGYGAALLAVRGAAHVVGVDIDAGCISRANATFGKLGVDYIVGDCQSLDNIRGSFDVICSFENIEHLRFPEQFLKNSIEKLAPGGKLICSTPDRAITSPFVNGRPANQYHVNEWYRAEFLAMLKKYFNNVDILTQVESHSYIRRKLSTNTLHNILAKISNHVLFKLLYRLYRFPQGYKQIDLAWLDGIATANPSDFPIVPDSIMPLYGAPWCHVAICQQPI